VLVASRLKPRRDLDLAREVHKSAMAALIDEGQRIEIEFENFKQGLRNPLDLLLPGLIVPLAGFLTKSLQKRSEQAHQPNAEAANGKG
jgi:hypothetical protein